MLEVECGAPPDKLNRDGMDGTVDSEEVDWVEKTFPENALFQPQGLLLKG
jgi:hypothetical protein